MILLKIQKEKIKILFIILLSVFLFSGCWDKSEPEERGFVTAMGIDKKGNSDFSISVEVPELGIFESEGGGESKGKDNEESENSYIESYSGKTIWSTVKSIDGKTDRKLDFGQIKLCILGEKILKDKEMVKQAIDALERNNYIWRKVIICSAKGKAENILKGYVGNRKTAGFFTAAFFDNNEKSSDVTFKKTLQDILSDLSYSGSTILPVMEIEDGEISFNGMAVIKDYSLVGYCENEIIKGYNIVREDIMETDITTKFNGIEVPLKVNKKNTNIEFIEDNSKVKCIISIDIEGDVEEYKNGRVPVSELEKSYKETVSKIIRNSFSYFKNELKTDVMKLSEYCRKKNIKLYKKFGKKDIFNNMELSENVTVKIKGTGTIN